MKYGEKGKKTCPYNTYTDPNILKIPIIFIETQADRWNYGRKKLRVHYLLNEMSSVKKGRNKTSNAVFSKRHFFRFGTVFLSYHS